MAAKIPTNDYLTAVKYRRSVYTLNDQSPASDERILEIIREIQLHTPSSYNTQPGRISLLLGDAHKRLWNLVLEVGTPLLAGAPQAVQDQLTGLWKAFGGKLLSRF